MRMLVFANTGNICILNRAFITSNYKQTYFIIADVGWKIKGMRTPLISLFGSIYS